jgi:hypothetical protein
MKKLFLILVCGIYMTACGPTVPAPPPPSAPTRVAVVTSAPAPSSAPIAVPTIVVGPTSGRPTNGPAVLSTGTAVAAPTSSAKTPEPSLPAPNAVLGVANVNRNKQSNGEILTTANISAQQNLGVGQIDLSYPDTMIVGESRTVHLQLSPAQQLVTSKKEATTKQPANSPNFVFKFSGNVDLYPVMNAQLIALGFDVNPTGRVQQVVDTSSPAKWSWVIKAKEAGKQELALSISIPAVVNGADAELSKNLQDLAIVITVSPQPVSLTDQIMQSIANNSGAIVVALIGLFGTIIGIVIKMRSDKAPGKKKL